jgi:hypothetical protein
VWNEVSGDKNRMGAILANMVDGVVALDANGEVNLANRAAESIFHVPPGGLEGKVFANLVKSCEVLHTVQEYYRTPAAGAGGGKPRDHPGAAALYPEQSDPGVPLPPAAGPGAHHKLPKPEILLFPN